MDILKAVPQNITITSQHIILIDQQIGYILMEKTAGLGVKSIGLLNQKQFNSLLLKDNIRFDTPELPYGCVKYRKTGIYHYFIVELQPTLRAIRHAHFDNLDDKGVNKPFKIFTPFVQHIFKVNMDSGVISNHRMSCTPKKYKDEDPLYHLPLNNIDNDHNVCMGSVKIKTIEDQSIASKINAVITSFWDSEFNDHYFAALKFPTDFNEVGVGMSEYGRVQAKFLAWQKDTLENPLRVMAYKWQKSKYSMEQLLS